VFFKCLIKKLIVVIVPNKIPRGLILSEVMKFPIFE